MNMDQIELDAAYDQAFYAPAAANHPQALRHQQRRVARPHRRAAARSLRSDRSWKLDIYRAKQSNAPIFVYIHGGAWLSGTSRASGYPAEMFMNAGAHFVALDFIAIKEAGGDLRRDGRSGPARHRLGLQECQELRRRSEPLYIGGHSSGGHLCGVALVTDWQKDFGVPADMIRGGLCMSGMYDMKPVRLSKRSSYVKFTDEMEQAMSSQRHLDMLRAPVIVTYGTNETPEFQRQNRDFVAAVKAAGKPAQLIEAPSYDHFEMAETLGNPYGPNGRAALAMMKLVAS